MVYYLTVEPTIDQKATENYQPVFLTDNEQIKVLEKITKDDIAVIECWALANGEFSIRIVQYLISKGVRIITHFLNSLFSYIRINLLKMPSSFLSYVFTETISYDIVECRNFSMPYSMFPMNSNNQRKIIIDTKLPETKVFICQTYLNSLLSSPSSKIIETANLVSFLKKEKVDFKNTNYEVESNNNIFNNLKPQLPQNVINSYEIINESVALHNKKEPVNFDIWAFPVDNYISDSIPLAIKYNKRIITTCQLIKETPFYDPKFILVKDSFSNLNQNDLDWINKKVEVKYKDGVDEYFSGDAFAKKILNDAKNGVKYTNRLFASLKVIYNLQ